MVSSLWSGVTVGKSSLFPNRSTSFSTTARYAGSDGVGRKVLMVTDSAMHTFPTFSVRSDILCPV